MSATFQRVVDLITMGDVKVSDHGYDELAQDGIFAGDALVSVMDGIVVEDYPNYRKGPCVLVLQMDRDGRPIHVLRGFPKARPAPAVLITAYRTDLRRWAPDFLRRLE
jgi:hypothetical protein